MALPSTIIYLITGISANVLSGSYDSYVWHSLNSHWVWHVFLKKYYYPLTGNCDWAILWLLCASDIVCWWDSKICHFEACKYIFYIIKVSRLFLFIPNSILWFLQAAFFSCSSRSQIPWMLIFSPRFPSSERKCYINQGLGLG